MVELRSGYIWIQLQTLLPNYYRRSPILQDTKPKNNFSPQAPYVTSPLVNEEHLRRHCQETTTVGQGNAQPSGMEANEKGRRTQWVLNWKPWAEAD